MAELEAVKAVDYSTMTKDQLLEELGKAYNAEPKRLKDMAKLSILVAKAEAAEEKSKKDALLAELAKTTGYVQNLLAVIVGYLTAGNQPHPDSIKEFTKTLREIKGTELDGADGVWFAYDFGETGEKMIGTRLSKSAPKKATSGTGTSAAGRIPAKNEDMLAVVGDQVMFAEDTKRVIGGVETLVAAGTTFKQAFNLNTNGNWKYEVRKGLLKATGNVS